MTSKMPTAYSGLSALIQAAASQLGELAEAEMSDTNSPDGSPPMFSNPATPTLDNPCLDLHETTNWKRDGSSVATVTPLLTSVRDPEASNFCFPEILMVLLVYPGNEDVVTFLPDGKYFAIRRAEFESKLLSRHFQLSTFDDFLRIAKEWGFLRINGNFGEGETHESYTTNETDSDEQCGRIITKSFKDDIYVFRHPHFEKNSPIDLDRIRHHSTDLKSGQRNSHVHAPSRAILRDTVSDGVAKCKRQLSPSQSHGNADAHRQRLRRKSATIPVNPHSLPLTGRSCGEQSHQLRRRSSLELREVAQAIAASKIHLNHNHDSMAVEKLNVGLETPTVEATDNSYLSTGPPDSLLPPRQERRQSTSSSLVDGGVETATHNIVTDAIEALLFDENHTRETYTRHQKELSISSLPGVVPITKQLFSGTDEPDSPPMVQEKNSNSIIEEMREATTSKPKSPSSTIYNTGDSLENASRFAERSSCDRNLRVSIPNDHDEAERQQRSMYGIMVVSPARMEAAAALVNQSRITSKQY